MQMVRDVKEEARRNANDYVHQVFELVKRRNPGQKEFLQAVREIFDSLRPVFAQHPEYIRDGILERIVEPERIISFRVTWEDDNGKVHVNRGYRVQYNSTLGPYKGGLRFHPSVNDSIIKFLGFEQIFKNALTGLPIGGGKGGADFDPKGKTDREIMRFCQSFITELSKHVGPDTDVPAGDIGVGKREIGYMFGHYKRLRNAYEAGVFTGKDPESGGSLGRKEATGYGLVYFTDEMLKHHGLNLKDRTTIVSGSGNVSIYAMEKAMEYGAKVIACSDSNGYIYDPDGINLDTVKQLKEVERRRIKDYILFHPDATYTEGCADIWSIPCEIALPCATQNELDEAAAGRLIENGLIAIAEGANMPCDQEAIDLFIENGIHYGPAKAANAGGVAVSAMEMSQNSMRYSWTAEEVNEKLHRVMKDIHKNCVETAEQYGFKNNLMVGANIAGFRKVADAMVVHGLH